jgi:membrane fusion protein, heavy metal efflux system
VFRRDRTLRPGIFEVLVMAPPVGEYELVYRIEGAGLREDVSVGRIRVGTDDAPGGRVGADAGTEDLEAVSFLKEQQWNTTFATAFVDSGRVHESVRGVGRVRAAAGGELHMAAPIDGIVAAEPWPHVGLQREAGATVLALTSRVSQGRTLAELQAIQTEKQSELTLARERFARLEGLVDVGAVSVAEFDAARARVGTLEAQAEAVRRQMNVVRGSGGASGVGAALLEVSAPFAGQVAEILVAPGQAVSAGDPLVRMVRIEPVWVEVQLAPGDARRLESGVEGLWVRATGELERTRFGNEQVALIAIAPEVDARTGRVASVIRVDTGVARLRLGSAIEAEVLLARSSAGVVIPASSIVDDAGVATVFVQLDGESFARREIHVRGREGDHFLVEGLRPGERLVTAGGAAIRRVSLISSGGADHGHVH